MSGALKKQPLGRGLSSLLGIEVDESKKLQSVTSGVVSININDIEPGKFQTRRIFDEVSFKRLVDSIESKGVLQPLLVRPNSGFYEIIAGERRWRAAKQAGLKKVPTLIREFSDLQAIEVGLIENIQRSNLTPIEEAEGYVMLMKKFNYTQDIVAHALGVSRSHVANKVRLLGLPKKVKELLNQGSLSVGHARALINIKNPEELADKIIHQRLNVRQTEKIIQRQGVTRSTTRKQKKEEKPKFTEKSDIEKQLTILLGGAPVSLSLSGGGGNIQITFHNMDDLDGLLEKFMRLVGGV